MNQEAALFHLKKASDALNQAVQELEGDAAYGEKEFQTALSRVYHHLNTAWNGRGCSLFEFQNVTEKNYLKWRQFPKKGEFFTE